MFRHDVTINGIDVAATYSDTAVNGVFLPILKKLADRMDNMRSLSCKMYAKGNKIPDRTSLFFT